MLRSTFLSLALLGLSTPGFAADFADPTWPCVQRKVETLSAGLMWASPFDPAALPQDDLLRREMRELAETLSLRRVSLEEIKPAVEAFAAEHDGNPDVLGQVFMTVFDSLNTRRTRIINGIGDFSLSQIALADKINGARTEMEAQTVKAEPDFDAIDKLEEQLDWDQVIYTDRQKSIQYLCETPVLIEKRLFEIAQMLQQLAREPG